MNQPECHVSYFVTVAHFHLQKVNKVVDFSMGMLLTAIVASMIAHVKASNFF